MMFTRNGKNSPLINAHLGADDVAFCTAQTPETTHICRNCKHYAEYEGVCCYYKSERVADFVGEDYSCKQWSAK